MISKIVLGTPSNPFKNINDLSRAKDGCLLTCCLQGIVGIQEDYHLPVLALVSDLMRSFPGQAGHVHATPPRTTFNVLVARRCTGSRANGCTGPTG